MYSGRQLRGSLRLEPAAPSLGWVGSPQPGSKRVVHEANQSVPAGVYSARIFRELPLTRHTTPDGRGARSLEATTRPSDKSWIPIQGIKRSYSRVEERWSFSPTCRNCNRVCETWLVTTQEIGNEVAFELGDLDSQSGNWPRILNKQLCNGHRVLTGSRR